MYRVILDVPPLHGAYVEFKLKKILAIEHPSVETDTCNLDEVIRDCIAKSSKELMSCRFHKLKNI
jgi:hypothetical protein